MKQAIEYLLFKSGISNYQISQSTGISQVVLGKYTNRVSDVGKMTLDNAERLNNYFKEMLIMSEHKFGTVSSEGKTYYLRASADFTGRQLLEWQTEEGYAEFSAPAVDADGEAYAVYWILKTVREDGEGIEDLGELNWDEVDRVTKL